MNKAITIMLTVSAMIMVAILAHYGYSVSMSETGQYFVQGYIGTAIPVFCGLYLAVIGAAIR